MKKLVCDKCGQELSDPASIDLVLKGMDAWERSVRDRGEEPRGIFPCEYYRICGGEMTIVEDTRNGTGIKRIFKKVFNKLA